MPDLLSRDGVSRAWEGQTVAVVCPGPSLNKEDIDRIAGLKTIVVNDAYLVARGDVLYFADERWFRWQVEGRNKVFPWVSFSKDEVRKAFASFAGQKVTIEHPTMAKDPSLFVLKNDGCDGISFKPNAIKTGSNSGYQALNIAILSGAKKILLVGFDMRYVKGRTHAHNGHEIKMPESAYQKYARNFSTMQIPLKSLDVEIVNCTPGSAINCFRFSTVEKELCPELTA